MLLGILSLIALLVIGWYFGSQKLLSDAEERVITAWGYLDRAYQERENLAAELLRESRASPALLEHLRSAWRQSVEQVVSPTELNATNVRQYHEKKSQLGQALDELKTSQQELSDKATQAEAEEHISQKINQYNAEVATYNRLVHRFPFSLLNFPEKPFHPKTDQSN